MEALPASGEEALNDPREVMGSPINGPLVPVL